jgi:catecholate siderophore receptor
MSIGKSTDITLSYTYLHEKSVTDYGQPTVLANGVFYRFSSVSARTYYGFANNDYAEYQTQIATFKVEHEFDRNLSIRNVLRWSGYRRQSESTIAQGVNATDALGQPVTAATPDSLLLITRNHDGNRTRDNADDALINQTDLTWKFATGGVKHVMVTGLELSRERLNRWNYTLDANPALAGVQTPSVVSPYLSPDPYAPLSYTKTLNLRALANGDTVAVYAQDQLELSRHWKAVLGLRWERFAADATTQTIITGATAAGPFQRTDRMLSGRAGLIWQPTDTQSYYVSAANSYNPAGELGVYAGTAQTNLNAVNQNLDPEENRNYEIGTNLTIARGLQLRSAIFRTEKINQRIQNSITGVTELDGKRRVDGVEFELTGSITPNWDVYSGVAYMDGRIVQASVNQGNVPLGVADWSGNVWTVYRLGGGWEVGGGVTATTGSYLTDQNNARIPDYAVVDATVAYVQKKYEVRANFYNITDKLYYIGGYQNASNRVIPGLPRSAALTVRYNFD